LSKFNSKTDKKANIYFGSESNGEVLAAVANRLGHNPNSIKNHRDKFDFLTTNDRKGWKPNNGSSNKLDNTPYIAEAYFNFVMSYYSNDTKYPILSANRDDYVNDDEETNNQYGRLKQVVRVTRDENDKVTAKELKKHLKDSDVQNGIHDVIRYLKEKGGIYYKSNGMKWKGIVLIGGGCEVLEGEE
jgi:hypothetical protein